MFPGSFVGGGGGGGVEHIVANIAIDQARIQGGGGPRVPKTTHTEEKKIKIGQPRSKIQAKTYHKTH